MTDWERHARGYASECHDAERVLAEALGMGVYPSDGPGTPGDYVMGDHTTTSLAMAAADEIKRLRASITSTRDGGRT